jgi:hypothetical protein
LALVVALHQRAVDSPAPEPESGALASLVPILAARAHAAGLRVVLYPVLVIDEVGRGRWRGTLAPPSWRTWFRGYGDTIVRLARLCEESQVELLVVGAELISSERHSAAWSDLIRSVRAVFRGRLTYSSNWDALTVSPFLDNLDYLSCNAYAAQSPLRTDEMAAGWISFQHRLVRWHQRWGRPILLMEVGFPSIAGSCAESWDYLRTGAPDAAQQALCFDAFFKAWRGQKYLQGLFVYAWEGDGGPMDRSYSPRGKPAATIITRVFAEMGTRETETSRAN